MIEKKIILIFGKRGSGKSYLAKKLIETERRLLIYDVIGEYTGGVIFEDLKKLSEFWLRVYRGNFRLIYRPLKPTAEIDHIAASVFDLGDLVFVCEEIDCFCTAYQISDDLAHVVQRGRHKNITLVGITQRPYGINRLLTSQAKEIYIFNTNEPRDIEYLTALLGRDVEEKIKSLNKYEYVYWHDGSDELKIGKA